MLRVKTGESGQKRRVNVQDPLRECVYELGTEQSEKASEANQIHLVTPKFVDQHPVVNSPIEPFRRQAYRVQAPLRSNLKTCRRLAV
jgi:hypothetical protein